MIQLLDQIDEISKYGLFKNLNEENKELNLERKLVKIYNYYFETQYKFDENEYPEFNNFEYSIIRENLLSNFPNFSFYKVAIEIDNIENESENVLADALDDLCDIIHDLQEIKWRAENTSENDAKLFFKFVFESHTKKHILNLLNYLDAINS